MKEENKKFCNNCGTRLYLSKERGYYEVNCKRCGKLHKGNK